MPNAAAVPGANGELCIAPRDCALAVTVPLTREEFIADLSRPKDKDYARHIASQRGGEFWQGFSGDFFWGNVYGGSARYIATVCEAVEKQGVTVQKAVKFCEFAELVRKFSVVTLVAHWKFTKFKTEDICDAPALWRALRAPQSQVQEETQKAVEERNAGLLKHKTLELNGEELAETLSKTLNAIMAETHTLYRNAKPGEKGEVVVVTQSQAALQRLTRPTLEEAFPGLLCPARAVEFSDGLRTISEVVEAVPENYTGVLDMTVCNSVLLGAAIKKHRRNCQVLINRYPTELDIRLLPYKIAIDRLAQHPAPFANTLMDVTDAIRDDTRKKSQERE